MKKNHLFFICFLSVWLFLILANFFYPKMTFSEKENRYLSTFPSFHIQALVNGSYATNLDTYINDHFVYRDIWLTCKSTLERLLGKTENNGVYIGKDGYLFEKFTYTKEHAKNLETAVTIMEQFAQTSQLPTYFAFIPNSIYLYSDKLPDFVEVANQEEIIRQTYANCQKVIPVPTVDILKAHKPENLYFKTDHHMTSTGAYYVYTAFRQTAHEPYTSLETYIPTMVSNQFLGTFDSKAQVLGQIPDEIITYQNPTIEKGTYDGEVYNSIYQDSYLKTKDKYSYFLNGNHALVTLETTTKNHERLLIIKDSYAHNLAQFLCTDYEEIHFIDPRYYKASISDYAKENHITQVLFLYNVANLIEDTGIRQVQ